MSFRVIVWGTGLVGKAVLRELLMHPLYEVVGVIVNSPEKDGQDVGTLLGLPATGILASTDSTKLLTLEADAVAYFGPSAIYADINMKNITASLAAGKNVVDTSMGVFENPALAPKELIDQLKEACAVHGKHFFSAGIDPGFGNDLFPMTLLGVCAQVNSIRTIEFIDAGTYPDQESLIQLGLKSTQDQQSILSMEGMMTAIWGGPLYMIAEAVGVEVESTVEIYDRWFSTSNVSYPLGEVAAGECAAHQIQLQGIIDGEPKIIIDHIHRLYPDAAPEWQRPAMDYVHANRIEIDGNPSINQETVFEDRITKDGNAGTCLATGMRAINAIPALCEAKQAILSTKDLPLITGRGVIH